MAPPPLLHPYLLAAYPVLYLYSRNLLTPVRYPLISLAAALAGTALLERLARLLLRDRVKSAIAVSLFLVLFFSYGQIILGLFGFRVGGALVIRGRYLLPLFTLLWVAGTVAMHRSRLRFWDLSRALNAGAAALVLLALGQTALGALQHVRSGATELPVSATAVGVDRREGLPDIYYLVLDAYAGPLALREQMGYDNSDFYGELRKRGFYVAQDARSNYAFTQISLASTLNMSYLDGVTAELRRLGLFDDDRSILVHMVADNAVVRRLKRLGYHYVHFDSGDMLTRTSRHADENVVYSSREFYNGLLDMTPFVHRQRYAVVAARRRRILETFERIPRLSSSGAPLFVFAHLMLPHKPAVFGPEGEKVAFLPPGPPDLAEQKRRYIGQLRFANKKVLELLDRLLARPGPRPVVIIHGDHGTDFSGAVYQGENLDEVWSPSEEFFRERMSILNAFLVPPEARKLLRPSISPVNNFRVLFRGVFGDRLELLPDRSYYSYFRRPYDFVLVPPPGAAARGR